MSEKLFEDVAQGDDGFWIFWPTTNKGCYTADNLKRIADELGRRNEPIWVQLDEAYKQSR